jgi:hypothetical protein
LDNCGNLKQKGKDTENKGEGKTTASTTLPKLTGKTVEYAIGIDGNAITTRDNLIKNQWIDSKQQTDGSYIVLKNMGINRGISAGDKIILVKKYDPYFIKPIAPDTLATVGKKWVDSKTAQAITDPKLLATPPKDVYKLLKPITYGSRTFKVGDVVKFTA